MMREDRLVLPIPPGVHWKDEMPILLPTTVKVIEHQPSEKRAKVSRKPGDIERTTAARGLRFGPLPQEAPQKAKRQPRPKVKCNPVQVAAARELRDRYLEQFNAGVLADGTKVLPNAKYHVARQMEAVPRHAKRLLPLAA
jgi:hypothetical protein